MNLPPPIWRYGKKSAVRAVPEMRCSSEKTRTMAHTRAAVESAATEINGFLESDWKSFKDNVQGLELKVME